MTGQPRSQKNSTVLLTMALLAVPLMGELGPTPLPAAHPVAHVDAGLAQLAHADSQAELAALVTFDYPLAASDIALLSGSGLTVLRSFPAFHTALVSGSGASVLAAAGLPGVVNVRGDDQLTFYGNTATVSTRAREAWDAKSTSTNPVTVGGVRIDGSGVGIAIVDSGIDATHPDLAPAVAANLKYVCPTPGVAASTTHTCYGNVLALGSACTPTTDTVWVAAPDTDTSSGHGTHVAGIAAGRGTMSSGRIMGAAPGAHLVGLGIGEGPRILFALEAFNWVLCHAAEHNIQVVSNSWGPASGPYVATDPINVAANALVASGITVLFATGNEGATGANTVSPYARNPTPGVIGVAGTYDGDRGARENSLVYPSSSRCLSTSLADDCPDVAAPGQNIVSTQAKAGPLILLPGADASHGYQPYYTASDGTSMSTPGVAGIIAQLKQADSTLTPAQIEDLLEDNAIHLEAPATYSITDPANPTTKVSPTTGHGLVDAIATLEAALNVTGLGSPQPQVSQDPHVYLAAVGSDTDAQLVGGVQWTVTDGTNVTLSERNLLSGDAATWPLTAGTTPCRFRVFPPYPAAAVTVPCTGGDVTPDTFPAVRMDAPYTFTGTGLYTVEPQIDFGSGYVAIDSFTVNVVEPRCHLLLGVLCVEATGLDNPTGGFGISVRIGPLPPVCIVVLTACPDARP